MTRYVDGERTDASGRATNVKDHWALPKGVIEALSELYSTNTHRFASPLNIDSRDITVTYYTPYKRDALFGASYDAYSCQWRGASLAHPTFSAKEAHQALQWALRSAASTTEATLTILVLPPKFEHDRDDAEYQRLLKHKGAQILFSIAEMPFQHSNFTESLQKYRYPTPCLIVLVCNDAGHDNFCRSEDDPSYGASLAKLMRTVWHHKNGTLISMPRDAGKPQFKASLPPPWQRIPPQPACNPTPPYDNTDIQTPHISARNLAWAGTEIVYTDGSAKDGKAGAGIILADSHIRVRMPEGGTSLKAELVAIASALKASQKDLPLFVATDCLVALHAIRNSLDDRTYARTFKEWQALEHAMSALHARHAETTFLKVKAHAGIAGNEMADREATAARKLDEHVEEELDGGIRVEDYVDKQPVLPVITMPAGGPVDPKWAKNLTQNAMAHAARVAFEKATESNPKAIKPVHVRWMDEIAADNILPPTEAFNKALLYKKAGVRNTVNRCRTNQWVEKKKCSLCGTKVRNIFHPRGACKHTQLQNMSTLASNAQIQLVAKAVRDGLCGENSTLLVNAGIADTPNGAEDQTIPYFMLPCDTWGPHGHRRWVTDGYGADIFPHESFPAKPDMVLLKNWKQEGPDHVPTEEEKANIIVVIMEHASTQDLYTTDPYLNKSAKYYPLVLALQQEGWNVELHEAQRRDDIEDLEEGEFFHPIHTVITGHAGSHRLSNIDALQALGVRPKDVHDTLHKMSLQAAESLHACISTYKMLCKTVPPGQGDRAGVG